MKTKTIIILSTIFFAMFLTLGQAQQTQNIPHQTTKIANKQLPKGNVQSSFVCFVNNKYMGKEQIPVSVDNKTYYGCCMGCVGRIKNNRAIRYAKDPLTGKEVDKATAFIVTKPMGQGLVWYFESEANYRKYKKSL